MIRPGAFALSVALALALAAGFAPRPSLADSGPAGARIVKVLTHYLDAEGRHTLSPSLFDRDAYQFELRRNPALRSGMRVDILWKSPRGDLGPLTLKLEMRGSKAPAQNPVVLTQPVTARPGLNRWFRLAVPKADYDALGDLLAWRVTLWSEDGLLAEQKSFLW